MATVRAAQLLAVVRRWLRMLWNVGLSVCALSAACGGCGGSADRTSPPLLCDARSGCVSARFDFRNGALGWQAGFADYSGGEEDALELQAGLRELPPEIGGGTGFYIQGNNHPDDLFMFLKRRLGPDDGVRADQTYEVRFTLVFASNAPTGCIGVGGSPGESVHMKAGATTEEPRAVLDADEYLRMNVDKGDQSSAGPAASVVGTIGNGIPCDPPPEDPRYVSLVRHHIHEPAITTSTDGVLWLLVGTDSGFESTTALYYQRLDVELVPVDLRTPEAAGR